jgi:hypothetical protein
LPVNAIALSPNDRLLAGACGALKDQKNGVESVARIWDMETGKVLQTFEGHTLPLTSVAFDSEGKRLLTGSLDHTLRVWDIATGKEIHQFVYRFERVSHPVLGVAFHPDGRRVFASGPNDDVMVFGHDPFNQVPLALMGGSGKGGTRSGKTTRLALSPKGERVAVAGSYPIDIWPWSEKALRVIIHPAQTLVGHNKVVQDLTFTPDGNFILSGSENELILWDTTTGLPVRNWSKSRPRMLSHNLEHLNAMPEVPWTNTLRDQFPSLRVLTLRNKHCTDAHLPELIDFPHLTGLDLAATSITDSGLAHVAEMQQLKQLDLSDTRITDHGLQFLVALPNLRGLWLTGTGVTSAGVEKLRTALPGIHIAH